MAYEVITLNLIPSGDIPVIHAAQYDVDRPLRFALKLGEDDFNPTGHTLELQIRKVDNNIVTAAPDDVTGNVVTFNSTEQMCACSGTNLGEIQIRKDDLDIATLHFYLVVQRDVLAGGLTSQSEIHDLEDQIAEIVPEVIGDEYYTAAEVDEKIAEIPTFDPTNYYDKTQLYTKTETNGLLSQKANTSSLANVAFSGSYTDLNNTPDIPDVSDYYTKEQTYSQSEVNTLLGQKADTSSLASVATTGDYADLINKPTIPAAQVNSDWNSSSGVSEILNKPTLATVATSGDYADLINKPTIPAAQVNSDWNSSSGVSEILNKPTLATVATSGDYDDLTNKPTVIEYGTDLPMSTTDPDKVADRIETCETALGNTYTQSEVNTLIAGRKCSTYSLVTTDTLTGTETTFNTFSGRKFSDYDLYIFTFGDSATYMRRTAIVTKSQWISGASVSEGVLHGSGSSSASAYSYCGIVISYNNDTSVKGKVLGSESINKFSIIGIKY